MTRLSGPRRRVRLISRPRSTRRKGMIFLQTRRETETDVERRRVAGRSDGPGGRRELLRLALEDEPLALPLLAQLRDPAGGQAELFGHLLGRVPLGQGQGHLLVALGQGPQESSKVDAKNNLVWHG